MTLGIRLHLARISLSNTVREIERFGIEWSRKAVQDWVQKAGLQLASNESPDHVALHETVIRINGQWFWLYAVLDPETNEFLHVRLVTTTISTLTQQFLREIREKHDVFDTVFLVDHVQHLVAALHHTGLRFQTVRHGTGTLLNVSSER